MSIRSESITAEEVKKFYDGIFSRGDLRDNAKYYAWIIGLLKPTRDEKLLDIACGGGSLLKEAARKGLRSYGLDISSAAVGTAKKNVPDAQLKVGEAENLPWPDDLFDYVTCLGSLEHFRDPAKGANEIARVLKKDASACIVLPNSFPLEEIAKVLITGDSDYKWQILDRSATKVQWRKFLEENGLKVMKILSYNKYPELFGEGTFKTKSLKKYVKTFLLRYLCPFNLSLNFVYICRKA